MVQRALARPGVNSLPAAAGSQYRVVNGDVVALGASFDGEGLNVADGSIDFTSSGSSFPTIIVASGASATESTTGEFMLGGADLLSGGVILEGTLTIGAEAGADATINTPVSGAGTIDANLTAGGNLVIPVGGGFVGTVNFNGSGDDVRLTGTGGGVAGDGRINLNSSTGANRLVLDEDGGGAGTVAFNEAGSIAHTSTTDRLKGINNVEVNAPVTVDLTAGPADDNERRLFVSRSLTGSADLTVNGTATDITDLVNEITLHEFEVGSTDDAAPDPEDPVGPSTYSGTITTNDFVNIELRRNLPAAAVAVNPNGFLEFGQRVILTETSIQIGEVSVAGGKLEVGHETDDTHVPVQLHVTDEGGRSGDLTLDSASELVMQVSGSGANDFDSIVVDGTANLDGTLTLLVNPAVPTQLDGTSQISAGPYTPTLGDTFDIIVAGSGLSADFNGVDGVNGGDLDILLASYGVDAGGDTNGDGETDGSDFLAWQTEFGSTAAGGTLIDNGLTLNVVDVDGVFTGTGLGFQLNASSTLVQLEVVASGAIAAVPEPSTVMLMACAVIGYVSTRRKRG